MHYLGTIRIIFYVLFFVVILAHVLGYLKTRSSFYIKSVFVLFPFFLLATFEFIIPLSYEIRYFVTQNDPLRSYDKTFLDDYSELKKVFGDYAPSRRNSQSGRIDRDGLLLYPEMKSEYLNINELGLRTQMPESTPKQKILLLGGSTVWGSWVKDSETISGFFENYLHEDVLVYNFGIEGYTFKNSVKLMKRFIDDYQPDVVIFYQGVNDFSFFNDVKSFSNEKQNTLSRLISLIIRKSYLIRELNYKFYSFYKNKVLYDSSISKFVDSKVLDYMNTLEDVNRYLLDRDVESMFFFQPNIFHKHDLSALERVLIKNNRINNVYLESVYDRIVDDLMSRKLERHYDLRNAIFGIETSVYMDYCHMNADGNKAIANHIYEEYRSLCSK